MGKIKNFISRTRRLAWGHKKISLVVLIAVLIVGFIVWPKGAKAVLTETAKKQDLIKMVSVTGKVSSDQSVNLSFQSGGKLIYLGAKEGDSVKKWQAIASLDKNVLEATYRQAQQDFIAAKAGSDKYYDGHKSSGESFDEKITRTALDAAQNKAYDNMMKAQQDLNNSTLYSPIDGILTRADAKTTGVNILYTTIFTVTDPNSLNFRMEVDETDIGLVKDGQKVAVTLDSFPDDSLKLTVDRIDFVSHTTTTGGNAFYVESKIPDVKNYRVGMSGNADITVGSIDDVLTISTSSIFDETYVYLKTGQGFEKKKVSLGLQNDTLAEVKSGLSEGDVVAADPTSIPQNQIKK